MADNQNDEPVKLEAVSEVRDLLKPDPEQPRKQFPSPEALALAELPPETTAVKMAHGRDSIEETFLGYLDKSRKYSDELTRQQELAGQFTGADTGVGVPEMQPSAISKGAPIGTYAPPTRVPPLPRNLEELKTFTGWNEPGFLESLLGAAGWKAHTVNVALKAFNAPFEALYNLIQNIPVKTEGEQAARETLAKVTYIGALLYAPGDLGLSKGIKALNRAAKEAKLAGEVAQRAAEIARGGK